MQPSKLMKRTRAAVRILPSLDIELSFDGQGIIMDYDFANRIAVMLRGQARKAKKLAGDHSTKVIGFADLTDATLEEMKAQRSRDATAIFLKP